MHGLHDLEGTFWRRLSDNQNPVKNFVRRVRRLNKTHVFDRDNNAHAGSTSMELTMLLPQLC